MYIVILIRFPVVIRFPVIYSSGRAGQFNFWHGCSCEGNVTSADHRHVVAVQIGSCSAWVSVREMKHAYHACFIFFDSVCFSRKI